MLLQYIKPYSIFVIQFCSFGAVFSGQGNELPAPPMCGVNPLANRIIGGKILALDEHPWMALLDFELNFESGLVTSDYQCGGVLINSRYVLTAAHCLSPVFKNVKRRLSAVRLGEHDLLEFPVDCEIDEITKAKQCAAEPIDYEVEKIIPHPEFDPMTKYNDIAMVRLAKTVEFSDSIKPVCLPTSSLADLKANETLYSIGWGSTLSTNIEDSASSVKRIVGLRLWDTTECREKFSVLTNQLCAGGEANQDACLGDSGGPFMRATAQYWYVEGVISYGNGCGKAGWPGVYTNVRSYLNWIKENLEP